MGIYGDFVHQIFGKKIDQVTEADLVIYFQKEREESDQLEFKCWFEKKPVVKISKKELAEREKAVLRTITAFLNSNGGLLIWGAPEGIKDENGRKVCLGALTPIPKEYYKEDFMGKVVNRIVPVTSGIRFQKIPVMNRFIYLVEVPSSISKPHQFDSQFYMRLDAITQIAPYHYIEALFKSISFPNLSLELEFNGHFNHVYYNQKMFLSFEIKLSNHSIFHNAQDVLWEAYFNDSSIRSTYGTFQGSISTLYHGTPHYNKINIQLSETGPYEGKVAVVFSSKMAPQKVTTLSFKFEPLDHEPFPNNNPRGSKCTGIVTRINFRSRGYSKDHLIIHS